uniref:Uncharacterized protein n=1 Tax=Arundo donax TaxID=35708 RepID=A0A0A9HBD7_ARUDO
MQLYSWRNAVLARELRWLCSFVSFICIGLGNWLIRLVWFGLFGFKKLQFLKN